MSLHLYEITETIRKIEAMLDAAEQNEDSSAVEAFGNAMEEWGDIAEDKLVAVAKVIDSLKAEADAIMEVANRQAARAKALQKRAEWLSGYALSAMHQIGKTEIKTPEMLIRIKRGTGAVEVYDESKVPAIFFNVVPESRVISKTEINKSLKALQSEGRDASIPGARLVFNEKLEIK